MSIKMEDWKLKTPKRVLHPRMQKAAPEISNTQKNHVVCLALCIFGRLSSSTVVSMISCQANNSNTCWQSLTLLCQYYLLMLLRHTGERKTRIFAYQIDYYLLISSSYANRTFEIRRVFLDFFGMLDKFAHEYSDRFILTSINLLPIMSVYVIWDEEAPRRTRNAVFPSGE